MDCPKVVMGDKSLTLATKAVAACLWRYATPSDPFAYPSAATLANDAGVSHRTAQRCLRRLAQAGYVKRRFGVTKCGRRALGWDLRGAKDSHDHAPEEGEALRHERRMNTTAVTHEYDSSDASGMESPTSLVTRQYVTGDADDTSLVSYKATSEATSEALTPHVCSPQNRTVEAGAASVAANTPRPRLRRSRHTRQDLERVVEAIAMGRVRLGLTPDRPRNAKSWAARGAMLEKILAAGYSVPDVLRAVENKCREAERAQQGGRAHFGHLLGLDHFARPGGDYRNLRMAINGDYLRAGRKGGGLSVPVEATDAQIAWIEQQESEAM